MKFVTIEFLRSVCTWLSFLPSVELQQLVKSDWSWIKKLPISLCIAHCMSASMSSGAWSDQPDMKASYSSGEGGSRPACFAARHMSRYPVAREIIHRGRRSDSRVCLREPGSRQCARSQQARQPAVPNLAAGATAFEQRPDAHDKNHQTDCTQNDARVDFYFHFRGDFEFILRLLANSWKQSSDMSSPASPSIDWLIWGLKYVTIDWLIDCLRGCRMLFFPIWIVVNWRPVIGLFFESNLISSFLCTVFERKKLFQKIYWTEWLFSIDWLTWLIDWLFDCSIVRSIDWLFDCSVDWLIDLIGPLQMQWPFPLDPDFCRLATSRRINFFSIQCSLLRFGIISPKK